MRNITVQLTIAVAAMFAMAGAAAQDGGEVMTNADIVALTEAGLSSAVIVVVIDTSQTDFDMSVGQLAALSRAGVDSAVIEAMARASTGASRSPAPQAAEVEVSTATNRAQAPLRAAEVEVSTAANRAQAPAATVSRRLGETFSDALNSGGDGPEMVVIPPGRFSMGCVSGRNCYDDELPVHDVTMPAAFAVSRYEVTFVDWDACAEAGGCGGYFPNDEGWGRWRRPAINVSWDDAQDYVAWLSGQTGHEYRLLTEAEWEYVARAGTETAYSWGNRAGRNLAHCDGCRTDLDEGRTAPVGLFQPNAFGIFDAHGNVWEWVEDCWNSGYEGAPSDGRAWLSGDCSLRVARGGAYYRSSRQLRSSNRSAATTGYRENGFGFRVARELTP